MGFVLRVTAVDYDRLGDTALTGVLESGEIVGRESISIPTASGELFDSVITSIEGPGPNPPPFRADKIGNATLFLGVLGQPPMRNIVVPCLAKKRVPASPPSLEDQIAQLCPTTNCGCAVEEFAVSPSGSWIVTRRNSGQGEGGYDVLTTSPLSRVGGMPDECGYMLEIARFSPDESRLVGGFGSRWLGGWWAHEDDEFEAPARGGLISFGFLLVHDLPSHRIGQHEMKIDLPKGWIPDDYESDIWYGARDITPENDRVRMNLYGGVKFEIKGPTPPVILLPTPHPEGGRLL